MPSAAERFSLSLAVLGFFALTYYPFGLGGDPSQATSLHTRLDDWIPAIPGSAFVYASIIPFAVAPLFVIRCRSLFRRVCAAHIGVLGVCLVAFALFPVTSIDLRVPGAVIDVERFSGWGLAMLYFLDPPLNLFPSLHVAWSMITAAAVWKAQSTLRVVVVLWATVLVLSTLTTKQHFAVDLLAGGVLGGLASFLTLRSYLPMQSDESLYSKGVAATAVLTLLAYVGLYALFGMGYRPPL